MGKSVVMFSSQLLIVTGGWNWRKGRREYEREDKSFAKPKIGEGRQRRFQKGRLKYERENRSFVKP